MEHFDSGLDFSLQGSRTYQGCLKRKSEGLYDQGAIFADSLSLEVVGRSSSFEAFPSRKLMKQQLPLEGHLNVCQTYVLNTFLKILSLTASIMPQNKKRLQSNPFREQAFGTKQVS